MFRSFSDPDTYAWTGHGNGSTAFTQNGLNQQTSIGGAAATWDSKGNLTSEPQSAKTYGYSSENLLTSATGGVTLGYDPALRLYQTVSGATTTRFLYDGLDAIAEYNGSSALQRRFVFDPTTGQPVLWFEGTGTTAADRRYLSQDERGSVISVSGSTGASLGLNIYDDYGKPGAANLGRYQYTGQKWIGEAGLYDYHFRDYLLHLGIFAQTDPIGQKSGPNLYEYVSGDPLNLVDPTGRNWICEVTVIWVGGVPYLGSQTCHNENSPPWGSSLTGGVGLGGGQNDEPGRSGKGEDNGTSSNNDCTLLQRLNGGMAAQLEGLGQKLNQGSDYAYAGAAGLAALIPTDPTDSLVVAVAASAVGAIGVGLDFLSQLSGGLSIGYDFAAGNTQRAGYNLGVQFVRALPFSSFKTPSTKPDTIEDALVASLSDSPSSAPRRTCQ